MPTHGTSSVAPRWTRSSSASRRSTETVRKVLRPRRTIACVADRLPDERLAKLVLDPVRLAGQDRHATPGFAAVEPLHRAQLRAVALRRRTARPGGCTRGAADRAQGHDRARRVRARARTRWRPGDRRRHRPANPPGRHRGLVCADLARSPAGSRRPCRSSRRRAPWSPSSDDAPDAARRDPRARQPADPAVVGRRRRLDDRAPQRRGRARRTRTVRHRPSRPRDVADRPHPERPRTAGSLGLGVARLDHGVGAARRRAERRPLLRRRARAPGRLARGDRHGDRRDRRGRRPSAARS